jgi:hypothetical protein
MCLVKESRRGPYPFPSEGPATIHTGDTKRYALSPAMVRGRQHSGMEQEQAKRAGRINAHPHSLPLAQLLPVITLLTVIFTARSHPKDWL